VKKNIIILLVILLTLFTGCAANYLPEGITKELLLERTTEIATLLSHHEYTGILEMYRADSKEGLTEEKMADLVGEKTDALGEFIKVREAIYSEDSQIGQVVCVILCEYERGTMSLRVIYDDRMNVLGIYSK